MVMIGWVALEEMFETVKLWLSPGSKVNNDLDLFSSRKP